jgi:F-type H+-transporting ATPase subunit a
VAEQKPGKKIGCGLLGCAIPLTTFIILLVVIIPTSIFGIIKGAFVGKAIPAPTVELPASTIFHLGPLPVTNTILTSWITVAILLLIAFLVTNRSKLVPGKLQSLVEMVLEWMYNFCKDVAGEKYGRKFFPLVTTIFLFVLLNAFMNLIPGFGSITYTTAEGTFPLLRGANTDINTALALAVISFVFVTYFGLKDGKYPFVKQFFNVGRFARGWGHLFTGKFKGAFGDIGFGFIDIIVSVLELISYFIRLVSFTFRLFGNMTGGEILILILFFLLGFAGFGLIQVGYIFEMLVGVVQALIFSGLTLVFASMAAEPHGDEGH